MTDATLNAQIRKEGRLLFVLLDSAAIHGLISAPALEAQWKGAKRRVLESGDFETDAELYYELLGSLASSGALAHTWIADRWQTVKARVEAAD